MAMTMNTRWIASTASTLGVVAVLCVLSGCGESSSDDGPDRRAAAASTAIRTSWPAPSTTPDPGYDYTGPYAKGESKMKAAGYAPDEIAFAIEVCDGINAPAEDDLYFDPTFVLSESQVHEVRGWLMLCPSRSWAPKLQAAIDRSVPALEQRDRGERFDSGTYRIGSEVKPGTYVAESLGGCYWERLDKTGEIIDNNFVSATSRVEVTVLASDYSFHSENCGEWHKIG